MDINLTNVEPVDGKLTINITGAKGSGKTTLATMLTKMLLSIAVKVDDTYYKFNPNTIIDDLDMNVFNKSSYVVMAGSNEVELLEESREIVINVVKSS